MSKKYIVDASFVLAYLLPDEHTSGEVDSFFMQYEKGECEFLSPHLLPFEVTNALRTALMRERISFELCRALLKDFLRLNILFEQVDFHSVFECAHRYNLSAYDASYIYLAKKTGVKLLTLDNTLHHIVS